MTYLRKAEERGKANLGWLDSRHSFSFGHYYDPEHMGFGVLRVINDDRIKPGAGFDTHSHRDMEIISYVIDGALAHKDSLGNGSEIVPGDVQRMSAGTGVSHSEFNPSSDQPAHFLQIWILPNQLVLKPGYAQQHFSTESRTNHLVRVISGSQQDGAISINQDVEIFSSLLQPDNTITYEPNAGRSLWLQVAKGEIEASGQRLQAGDGVGFQSKGDLLEITGKQQADFLLFDFS